MLKRLAAAYFSPTGSVEKSSLWLAENLAENIEKIDLSLHEAGEYSFKSDDTVIFAAPVFGGRIPSLIGEKLEGFKGSGTNAITVVVYGNRAYEDALLELNDCVEAKGFNVIASLALVAQHSIYGAVAAGRPDAADKKEVEEYAKAILEKLNSSDNGEKLSVLGNRPYKEFKPLPAVPETSSACVKCKLCAEKCPVGAISPSAPSETDPKKCISCMRCISICPTHARAVPPAMMAVLKEKLSPIIAIRNKNQMFI